MNSKLLLALALAASFGGSAFGSTFTQTQYFSLEQATSKAKGCSDLDLNCVKTCAATGNYKVEIAVEGDQYASGKSSKISLCGAALEFHVIGSKTAAVLREGERAITFQPIHDLGFSGFTYSFKNKAGDSVELRFGSFNPESKTVETVR